MAMRDWGETSVEGVNLPNSAPVDDAFLLAQLDTDPAPEAEPAPDADAPALDELLDQLGISATDLAGQAIDQGLLPPGADTADPTTQEALQQLATSLLGIAVEPAAGPAAGPTPAAPDAPGGGANFNPNDSGDLADGIDTSDLLPPTALAFGLLDTDVLVEGGLEGDEASSSSSVASSPPAGGTGSINTGVTIAALTPTLEGGDAAVFDSDLPGGSSPDAAALTATGSFTLSAPDGLDTLTAGGTPVITGGSFAPVTITTALGHTLAFTAYDPATGTVSYAYTLTGPEAHAPGAGENDLFETVALTLTDSDGDSTSADLDLRIVDDVPEAADDSDSVTEDEPLAATGNVVTGVDGGLGSDANTTDGVADTEGADRPVTIAWTGEAAGTVAGTYGILTVDADGNYRYDLDNADPAVQALSDGDSLTETFAYTLTDADGDSTAAALTITIDGADDGVTIGDLTPAAQGGDATVDEDDLPAGSSPDAAALTATGSFTLSAPDGLDTLTASGTPVITGGSFAPVTLTTALGHTLAFTAYDPATGTVSYAYTLTGPEAHAPGAGENDLFETVALRLTDRDGDSTTAGLDLRIVDDVPEATADTDEVAEDGPLAATGNVITGVDGGLGSDANTTDGVADTQGADRPVTIAWTGEAAGSVAGTYGILTVDADGNYRYDLDNADPAVQALSDGDTLTETFAYTLTDADGDGTAAALTITIDGADDGVTIGDLTPAAQGGDATVDEDDLPGGSSPDAAALTATGTFTLSAPDGLDTLTAGGTPVIAGGSFTPVTITTALGHTLAFTAYDPATGTVSYAYTLIGPETHAPGAGENDLFETVALTLTDRDGDSTSANLDLRIVDDLPTALADADSVTEDGPLAATGNVVTGEDGGLGSDANTTDGVADTEGADRPVTVAWTGEAAGTVAGTYGILTVDADGNYRYDLDNTDPAVQALSDGDTLTESFAYTATDADGDSTAAALTITIDGADDGVTIGDLTPAAQGGDAVVDEDDLPGGSSPDAAALTATGSFTLSAPDGLDTLTASGTPVIAGGSFAPVTITTALGHTLAFTAYDPATGTVSYAYTLTGPEAHAPGAGENDLFETVALTLTDSDGDSTTAGLDLRIVDDVPEATADTDEVAEDGPLAATGNVVTGLDGGLGSDANTTDGVADTEGADRPVTVAWTGEAAGTVAGTYGILTVDADGNYRYDLDNTDPAVQALSDGDTLTESFAYTLTDADGDSTAAALTITIDGADDGVTIGGLIPAAQGGDATVDEDDLPGGSSPDAAALTATGSFTLSAPTASTS